MNPNDYDNFGGNTNSHLQYTDQPPPEPSTPMQPAHPSNNVAANHTRVRTPPSTKRNNEHLSPPSSEKRPHLMGKQFNPGTGIRQIVPFHNARFRFDREETMTTDAPDQFDGPPTPIRPRITEPSPLFEPPGTPTTTQSPYFPDPFANSPQQPGSSNSQTRRRVSPPPFSRDRNNLPPPTQAHKMKMALNLTPGIAGTSIPHPRERRPMPEDDPENHLIKHLRVVKRMSWNGIVRHMNHERIKAGKEPSFTEAAVYGRFVRNGPRIAAREGDTDFDPRDYMHLRVKEKERRFLTGGGWGRGKMKDGEAEGDTFQEKWNARMDEILVEAYGEVTEELWVIVARRLADKTGMRFSAEGVAKRFHQI